MLCTGTHTDLFGNIFKQVGGKRCPGNTDALSLHMINRMRKEPNCFGTLEIGWSLLRSLSFRAGLSQINNLCNILSQSVHSNSLVANWHLTHYCIKVIFCGNNLWILCRFFFVLFFSLSEQNQQTSRGKEWRAYTRSQDILTCNSRNNINANI